MKKVMFSQLRNSLILTDILRKTWTYRLIFNGVSVVREHHNVTNFSRWYSVNSENNLRSERSWNFSLLKQKNEDIVKVPDLMNVQAMPFFLEEGGKYIIDFLEKSKATTVTIFVRTSVLANELVNELKENDFNAIEVNHMFQDSQQNDSEEQCIFVVSDRNSSIASLPKSDLVIQVQTPLLGLNVMKERLHISNFNNSTMACALFLYNYHDSHFLAQLTQLTTLRYAEAPSFHVIEIEDSNVIEKDDQTNLPALKDDAEKAPVVSRKVKSALFKPVYPEGGKKNIVGFVDRVRLYVIGGTGGNGSPRTGARGGDGGDVIIECQSKARLDHFRHKENRRPTATHGQHCCVRAKRVNGQRGIDLIIPVPLGTLVKDERTGHVIADIDHIGQRLKVVCGGRGGSPNTFEGGGEKGEKRMIILEYKMQTDVGLVGFPNAGKSTLLRALSRAKPKVAEYAFTSLKPTLGRVELKHDFSQLTIADLPGLIEGAHQNKGLGLKFLRHVERANLLLFVVDINGFQLSNKYPGRTAFETVFLLAKELFTYNETLVNKPKILVINKMDCDGAEKRFLELKETLNDVTYTKVDIEDNNLHDDGQSSIDDYSYMMKRLKFEEIIPVSALNKSGIEEIINSVQRTLTRDRGDSPKLRCSSHQERINIRRISQHSV